MPSVLNLRIFISEQLPIVFIAVIYFSTGYIVQYGFGVENMMTLRFNYRILDILAVSFSVIFLNVQIIS